MPSIEAEALALLRRITGEASAVFHAYQLEAIQALVRARKGVFLVQRIGAPQSRCPPPALRRCSG